MDFKPVAGGFCFLEAPRADGGVVWFTDVVLGGLRRLFPTGGSTNGSPAGDGSAVSSSTATVRSSAQGRTALRG
jgi:streptogramin lyase